MKKLLTLLLINLVFVLPGNAQVEFGAIGSYWIYDHHPHDGNGYGWDMICVEKDTMIDNEVYKIIRRTYFHQQSFPPLLSEQYTGTHLLQIKNDSVFIDHNLVLDFNMAMDDSLDLINLVPGMDLEIQLTVDSITSEEIDGVTYKKWYGQKYCLQGAVPDPNNPYEEFVILENIGQIENGYLLWNTDGCIIGGGTNSFNCYKNGDFTYPPSADCQKLELSPTENITAFESIKVYPNPVTHFLNINSSATDLNNISIIDLTGKVLLQKKIENEPDFVNVAFLKRGIYFLKMESDQATSTFKFLKL